MLRFTDTAATIQPPLFAAAHFSTLAEGVGAPAGLAHLLRRSLFADKDLPIRSLQCIFIAFDE